ncbi:MAG: hypothetical protein HYT72_00685 [Candidatus Aenigmarchaeota archaeon]|nr:hypothetical protein [Candidatus Aenigmarchaeota archaeon]
MIFPEIIIAERAEKLGISVREYWSRMESSIFRELSDQQLQDYLDALETVKRFIPLDGIRWRIRENGVENYRDREFDELLGRGLHTYDRKTAAQVVLHALESRPCWYQMEGMPTGLSNQETQEYLGAVETAKKYSNFGKRLETIWAFDTAKALKDELGRRTQNPSNLITC